MTTSEAILQVLSGSLLSRSHHSNIFTENLNSVHALRVHVNNTRKRKAVNMQVHGCSGMLQNCRRVFALHCRNGVFCRKNDVNRLESMGCNCQRAEIVSGSTAEDPNETWFTGEANTSSSVPVNGTSSASGMEEFELGQQSKDEKGDLVTNGMSTAAGTVKDSSDECREKLIEDEAWNLLRDSIVYYCNIPIGTIAANDSTSPSILNYDQIFIRDFIPSGVAFLLKGEYDIVRNFILYTLQLQVM